MVFLVGLFALAALVSFLVLRMKGGTILNILVFAAVAIFTAIAAIMLYHLFYPMGHPQRFAVQPFWVLGGGIAAIAGPLVGAILARLARKSGGKTPTPQGDGS